MAYKALSRAACEEQGNKWTGEYCSKVSVKDFCEQKQYPDLEMCMKEVRFPLSKIEQLSSEYDEGTASHFRSLIPQENELYEMQPLTAGRVLFDYASQELSMYVPSSLLPHFEEKLEKLEQSGAEVAIDKVEPKLYQVYEWEEYLDPLERTFDPGFGDTGWVKQRSSSPPKSDYPRPIRNLEEKTVDFNKGDWQNDFKEDDCYKITLTGDMIQNFGHNITIPTLPDGSKLIAVGKVGDPVISKIYSPDIVIGDKDREQINHGSCERCCHVKDRNVMYLVESPDGSRHTYGSTCGVELFGAKLDKLFSAYRKGILKEVSALEDSLHSEFQGAVRKRDLSQIGYYPAMVLLGRQPDPERVKQSRGRATLTQEEQKEVNAKIDEIKPMFDELKNKYPENGYYDNTYAVLRDAPGKLSEKWVQSILNTVNKVRGIEVQRQMEAPDKNIEGEPNKMTDFTGFKIVYIKEGPPPGAYTSEQFPAHKIIVKRPDGQKGMFRWDISKEMPFKVGDNIDFRAKIKGQGEGITFLSHTKNVNILKPG